LRRWEELRPELDRRDVRIVTVCTDTPEKIRSGRTKHGLQATMLSDRSLAVTNLYGLRNQAVNTGPPGVPGQPVPTTILADATGRVLWMDQSENYQRRSEPGYVLAALEAHLPR
jgi:peroxiredoxin